MLNGCCVWLNNIADQRKQQTQHDRGAQWDIDTAASQAEVEIAGEFAKSEAAQEGGEPAEQKEGENGDEEPAHRVYFLTTKW